MTLEIWFSFMLAAMIMCFTPGPTTLLVLGQALNHGKKSVLPLIAGTMSGDILVMSFSFIGMGAVLATSSTLFLIVKYLGALYLIYLGIKAWRSSEINQFTSPNMTNKKAIYREALVVTALNPKGIIFFMAFFPLFINSEKALLPQMLILASSFMFISMLTVACYSLGSGVLRHKMHSKVFQRTFSKVSGGLLISAGLITCTMQK